MLNYDDDKNAESLRQYKSRFSLIVEHILTSCHFEHSLG